VASNGRPDDHRDMADHPTPVAGPSRLGATRYWAQLFRDPLAMYTALRRDYGDAVRIPFAPGRAFYLLSRPEHAEHVLVAHQDRYVKAFTYRPLKAFLGDGLLTSEGATWQRHRRLIQPVFSHRHVAAFAPDIVAAARARGARWRTGSTIDVASEMRTLTMDVVGRVLFGTDLADDAESVGAAVSRLQAAATVAVLIPSSDSPERARAIASHVVPGLGRSIATLDGLVERVIAERLAVPRREQRDMLDLLNAAGEGTDALTRTEIRDEVMTLVLAGHETTANTLTWTLTLLSRYPAARERLEAEVEEVLAGQGATAEDADKLVWTRAVVSEAMRLYPPAWTIERDAAVDDDIAGVPVPKGNTIAISPYLMHRNPEFWPNPEGFDPDRFLPERSAGRPKYAFIPFGGGRRICVGAGFAQLEATLALATLAGSHRLDLVPGAAVVAKAGVTIHPRGALPMTVCAR
jgi:cytochrome P450